MEAAAGGGGDAVRLCSCHTFQGVRCVAAEKAREEAGPGRLRSDRERGERSPLGGTAPENEGVNTRSREARGGERSRR